MSRPGAARDVLADGLTTGPGRFEVVEELATWSDPRRARDVPVKLYGPPPEARGGAPAVVVSAGLGGSRESYAYFGRRLATRGYVCVYVQHPGSDAALLLPGGGGEAGLLRAALDPAVRIARVEDLRFAADEIAAGRAGAGVDGIRLAAIGHSFGAYTALAAVGQLMQVPGGQEALASFADPRFHMAVGMSTQALGTLGLTRAAWGAIAVPCLTLAGSLDTSVGCRHAASRRDAFDRMVGPAKYHVTIHGANHYAFCDEGSPGRDSAQVAASVGPVHEWVLAVVGAVLDAFLPADAAARAWLDGDGLARASGGVCTLERK